MSKKKVAEAVLAEMGKATVDAGGALLSAAGIKAFSDAVDDPKLNEEIAAANKRLFDAIGVGTTAEDMRKATLPAPPAVKLRDHHRDQIAILALRFMAHQMRTSDTQLGHDIVALGAELGL